MVSESQSKEIKKAMPDVKGVVEKHGRYVVILALDQITEYEIALERAAATAKEVKDLEAKL